MTEPVRLSISRSSSLAVCAANNGVAVGSLYVAQALVAPATAALGPSLLLPAMPAATLAGYALGVAASASLVRDLSNRHGLAAHVVVLAAALTACALATIAGVLIASCLAVGLGCSLTQRLLARVVTEHAGKESAQAIGIMIAAGLCGIVAARSLAPLLCTVVGWRGLLMIDAGLVLVTGAACVHLATDDQSRSQPAPAVVTLWRAHRPLRAASIQQAFVFAAYNIGWARYVHAVAPHGASVGHAVAMGIIASLGAAAALGSGRVCSTRDPTEVAWAGVAAIAIAAALAGFPQVPHGPEAAMGLLDMGTQIALVANQARVQKIATNRPTKGRVAAIVTVIGFAGGATGAWIGNALP